MLGADGQHLVAPHGALRICNATKKRQLEDVAKANPGKVNLGSQGIGSIDHVAGELRDELIVQDLSSCSPECE
jgi:hypothetical protein